MLYIKDGKIKDGKYIIVIKGDIQIINPSEETILADGWLPYTPPTPPPYTPSKEEMATKYVEDLINNRVDMNNDEALKYEIFVHEWSTYIDKELKIGKIVAHKNKLYRVRQDISKVLENQEPSVNTAALYEVIDKTHVGTKDDPIPYNIENDPNFAGLELFKDKYYIQDKLYLCIRDSETSLIHDLSTLVNNYVTIVE